MRVCLLALFCLIITTTANAEGLPANPWKAKNNNAGYAQVPSEQIINSVESKTAEDIAELKNTVAAIERKLEQNQNSTAQTDTQTANDNTTTVEALGALNTLSKYMNKNNDTPDIQHTVNKQNSDDLNKIKKNFSEMIAQSKEKASAQNSYAKQKADQAKYEYNQYKAKIQSNYNSIKNKTKPLYDDVKKSFQEVERKTGVKF